MCPETGILSYHVGRNEHKMQDPFGGDDIHVHFPAGALEEHVLNNFDLPIVFHR